MLFVYSFVTFVLWIPDIYLVSGTCCQKKGTLHITNRHGCKLSMFLLSLGWQGHQDLNKSFGTYRSETCDGAPQRLKIVHNYFTNQWRKVFRRAPFHQERNNRRKSNQIPVQAKKSKYLDHSQVNFSSSSFPFHVDTKSHVQQ